MAPTTRSSGGCWTCRLRRKKCDEERPLCQGCLALEIECLYTEDKPEWMDGGELQRQKAEWLKKEVKRKATHRRERRYLQGLEVRLESLDASLTDDSDIVMSKDLIHATAPSVSTTNGSTPHAGTQESTPASGFGGGTGDSPISVPSPDDHAAAPVDHGLLGSGLRDVLSKEVEAHSTMLYLDYAFPFLFPYYRPSFADAGRGWLLVLLAKNKALFHSALSLAGYFYSIVLGHIQDAAPQCQTHNLEALHEQQGLALQWLRREMQDIITRGVKGNLAEANRVMASIIQLMTSDVAIGKPGNWPMHLEAAAQLFNEIMKHHAVTDNGHVCFMMVLLQLGSRPFSWTPKNHPWGSDQATLRFFTAQLLFVDTLASTTLQQPPRLHEWHQHILMTIEDDDSRKQMPVSEKEQAMPHIHVGEFVGVENWVVVSIGEIAALDAWKKEMKRAGSLSVAHLAARASVIEQRLRGGLQKLDEAACKSDGPASIGGPDRLLGEFAGTFSPILIHGTALNNRIWAQAAISYLSVVLSGWQPSSLEIRNSVAQTIELLLSLASPDCLRTVVWPFTVTGCLAAQEQEQIFRDMVGGMGPLKVFGTIREGVAILEHVWGRRAEIDANPDQWDIGACLNCLAEPALLI